jgi:hypothetical protein
MPSQRALSERFREQYPVVCASTYRYAVSLPSRLIAACEEISPHLVVLKSVWPLLLAHYDSPSEWFARWVDWIERENARRCAGTRYRHQGDARDLVRFISAELTRLHLAGSDVADLVSYERLKLEAALFPSPPAVPGESLAPLSADTVIVSRCAYVADRFHHDLRTLVAGQSAEEAAPSLERHVVCFKDPRGDLRAVQLSGFGRLVLDLVDKPRRIGDLFEAVASEAIEPTEEGTAIRRAGLHMVQQLITHGLVQEVARS